MELSAEVFEQTISRIKADKGRAPDKRAHPRVGVRYRMKIGVIEAKKLGKPIDVWVRDLSRSGIGIMCPLQMLVGAQFIIMLPHLDDAPPLKLVCKVTNCRALAPGMFAVGADFKEFEKSIHAAEAAKTDAKTETKPQANADAKTAA